MPTAAGTTTTLVGGTLTGAGTLLVNGILAWTFGTQSGTGETRIGAGGTLVRSGTSTVALTERTLRNEGLVTVTGTGAIQPGVGARIVNALGATFDLQADSNIFAGNAPAARFENAGTLTKTGGTGTSTISIQLDNDGLVHGVSGNLRPNAGDGAGSSETGTYTAGAGASIDFGGGTFTLVGGSNVTGTGTIEVSGGTVSFGGAYGVAGTTLVTGGTADFAATAATTGDLTQSGGVVTGTGALAVGGTFTWSFGTQSGSGETRIAPGATLLRTGGSTTTLTQRTLRNQGSAIATSTGAIVAGGASRIVNEAGATYDLQGDAGLFAGVTPGRFENAGTLVKSGGLSTSTISIELDNDGTVGASSGTLVLSGGDGTATQTGSFGGTGTGLVDFTAGLWDLAAGSSFTGRVELSSGTVSTAAGATVPIAVGTTTTLDGGIVTGPGTLLVDGTLVWTFGTQSGAGETRIAAGGTLVRAGTSTVTLSERTLRNEGATTVTGSGSLTAGNGARIVNATGATFDVQADSGIFTGAAPVGRLENAGTFRKSGGAGTSTISVELDNDGSLAASSGLLRLSGGDGTATQTGSFGGTGAGIVEFIAGGYDLAAGSSFTGQVNLTGGTLDTSVGATVPVAAGTTTTQSGATLTGVGTLLVNGTLVWTSGTQSGTGETHVAAGGTLTRSGALSTTLSARTIRNEGLFAFSGAGGIFAGTGARIVNAAGGTFDIQGDGGIFEGAAPAARLENAGTLKKSAGAGSSTIAIELDNDGVIEAASGILNVTGDLLNFSAATSTLTGGRYVVSATFRFSNADIVTNAADVVLDGAASAVRNFSDQDAFRNLATNAALGALTIRGGRTLTAPGAFANGGTLTVLAGSTFESTGPLANTGLVAGTGTVKGQATNDGTFAPGVSPGILRVDGPYTNAGGTLAVEIGGTTPGTGYDQLEVLGAVTLGGILQITTLPGFTPTQGQSFVIATGTSVTGSFADVVGAELGSGLRYVVQTTATSVVLTVVSNAISVGNATANEGADATFTVTLSPATATTVTVAYATADGTAVDPADFDGQSGTLTFAPGETTKTVTVPTVEDALDEHDEEFTLVLSSPVGASIGDGTGAGQITDDDPMPTLSIADASVNEGDEGVVKAEFAVTLSAASGRTVTVGVATQDGTATGAGDDYETGAATLTFLPGETTKTFSVDVNGDDAAESDETFGASLADPVTATILDGAATGTILDDDGAGADLAMSKSASEETVSVGSQFTYTLSVFNQGSGTASSVQVTDDLPGGVTLVSATPSAGGSCGTVDPVVCTLGVARPVRRRGRHPRRDGSRDPATLVNTATASSPDDVNAGNNSGTATVDVAELADLAVTKTASPTQGIVGEPLTYTLTVTNGDSRATADRPDDEAGEQIHVIYVLPSDRPDRSFDLDGTLAGSVDSFQGWLRTRPEARHFGSTRTRARSTSRSCGSTKRTRRSRPREPSCATCSRTSSTRPASTIPTSSTRSTTTARVRSRAAAAPGRRPSPATSPRCTSMASRAAPCLVRATRSRRRRSRRRTKSSRCCTRSCTRSASCRRARRTTGAPATSPTSRTT